MKKRSTLQQILSFLLIFTLLFTFVSCEPANEPNAPYIPNEEGVEKPALTAPAFDLASVPAYSGSPYVAINGNLPYFTENQYTAISYEYYSPLDALGRCGATVACIGIDLMPTEPRESISSVKPTGWQSVQYDIVSGKSLYNRCHLIGFQLSGENANQYNLITGTRYLNIEGMLPFENMIADYVKETNNHVLFRVTPIFDGNNLVASGVLMEAYSIEDQGDGICFNVYAYNVQPGIVINYADGTSYLSGNPPQEKDPDEIITCVLNTNTKRYHKATCSSVADIAAHNREDYTGKRGDLDNNGYKACGNCNP